MSDINKAVGTRLRQIRKERNLTMEQLSERVHKSKSTIAKYESGDVCIDIETLEELSKALSVHIFTFLGDTASSYDIKPMADSAAFFPKLFFYYYDGRKKRIRSGEIAPYEVIDEERQRVWCYFNVGENKRNLGVEYTVDGILTMRNPFIFLELGSIFEKNSEVNIYAYNFMGINSISKGIITGIFKNPIAPGMTKVILSKYQLPVDDTLKDELLFSKQEISRIKELNIFTTDNMF